MGKEVSKNNKRKTNVIIKMSNNMARAKFTTNSVVEARIIATLASMTHKDDKDFVEYNIPIKKFFPDGYKGKCVYKIVKESSENLISKVIKVEKTNEKNKREFIHYTIFSKLSYIEGDSCVSCKFNPEMKPHLLKLNGQFAQVPLEVFLHLKSVYTQKLMLYLWSYRNEKYIECSFEDLCERFNCSGSYRIWTNFNRFVLKPGINELNRLARTNITYKTFKEGRKVAFLGFDVSSIPKPYITIQNGENKDNNENKSEIVNLLMGVGINEKEALKIEENLQKIESLENPIEWLQFHINAVCLRYDQKKNSINSTKGGYLYKALMSEIQIETQKSKKHEKLKNIRNSIESEKILPKEIDDSKHSRTYFSLNAWQKKGVITEKERDVLYTYYTDSDFMEIYNEISQKYQDANLSELEMFQIRARRIFEDLSGRL